MGVGLWPEIDGSTSQLGEAGARSTVRPRPRVPVVPTVLRQRLEPMSSNSSLLARDGIRPLASRSAPSAAASTSSWRGGGAPPAVRRRKEKLGKLNIDVQAPQWSAREGDDLFTLDVVAADGSARWTTHRRWREFLKLAERLPAAGLSCRLPPTSRRDMTARIAALQTFVDAVEPSTMHVPVIATFLGANAFVRAATHRSALMAVDMAATRQTHRAEAAAGRSEGHQVGRADLLSTSVGGGVSTSPPPDNGSTLGAVARGAVGTEEGPTPPEGAFGMGRVDGELPSPRSHRGLPEAMHMGAMERATLHAPVGWAHEAGPPDMPVMGVLPSTASHQASIDDLTSSHRQLEGSATDATGDGAGEVGGGAASSPRATAARCGLDSSTSESAVADPGSSEAAVSAAHHPFFHQLLPASPAEPAAAAAPASAAAAPLRVATAAAAPTHPPDTPGPELTASEAAAVAGPDASVEKAYEANAQAEAGGEAAARAAASGTGSPRSVEHDPALALTMAAPPAQLKPLEVDGCAVVGPSMASTANLPELALLAQAPSRAPASSVLHARSMTPSTEARPPASPAQGSELQPGTSALGMGPRQCHWPCNAGTEAEPDAHARFSPAAASVEPALRLAAPCSAGQESAGQGASPLDPAGHGADTTARSKDATHAPGANRAAVTETGDAAPRGDATSGDAARAADGSCRWSVGSSLSFSRGSLPSTSVLTQLGDAPRAQGSTASRQPEAAHLVDSLLWLDGGLPTCIQPIAGKAPAGPSASVNGDGAMTPGASVNRDGALTPGSGVSENVALAPGDGVKEGTVGTSELEVAFRRALSAPAVRLCGPGLVALAMANSAPPPTPAAPPATTCAGAVRLSTARASSPPPARQAAGPAGPAATPPRPAAAIEAAHPAAHGVALRSSSVCLCAAEHTCRSPAAALAEHEATASEAARRMAEHVAADEGARAAAGLYAVEEAMRLATEQATLAEVARAVAELALSVGAAGTAAEQVAAAEMAHCASVEAARACSARVAVAEAARRAAEQAHAEDMVAMVAARVAREFSVVAQPEGQPASGDDAMARGHPRGEETTRGRAAARVEQGAQRTETASGAARSMVFNGIASDAARVQPQAAERAEATNEAARAAVAAAHAHVERHGAAVRPPRAASAQPAAVAAGAVAAECPFAGAFALAAAGRNAATTGADAQLERLPGVHRGEGASVCPEAGGQGVEAGATFDAEQARAIEMIKLSCCPRSCRSAGEDVAPPLLASPTLSPSLAGVGGGTSRGAPRVSFAAEAVISSLSPMRSVRQSSLPDSPSGEPAAENPSTAVTERTAGGSAAYLPPSPHSPAGGEVLPLYGSASSPLAAPIRKSPPSADLQCAFERRLSAVQSETEQLQTSIAALLALPPIGFADDAEDGPSLHAAARSLAPPTVTRPRLRRRGCAAWPSLGHLLLLATGLALAAALYCARASPALIDFPPPSRSGHVSADAGPAFSAPEGRSKRRPAAPRHASQHTVTLDVVPRSRRPGDRLRAGAVAVISLLVSIVRHVPAAANHVALGLSRIEVERLQRQRDGAAGVWQWAGLLVSRAGRVLDRFGSTLEGRGRT